MLCGQSDQLSSRDPSQPRSLGSSFSGKGLGVTGDHGPVLLRRKAVILGVKNKCNTQDVQRRELGWLWRRFDSSCRKVREALLGVHGKTGLCCKQRATIGFKRSFVRLRGVEQ